MATAETELELIERMRGGDTAAFYELVNQYERRVYWAAFGLLGNAADAEDVTQETFLKCFQHLDQFRGEAKFSTWLIQIAVNEAKQRLRKQNPGLLVPLESEGETAGGTPWRLPFVAEWRENPEQQYAAEELRRIVTGAVESLPPIYRSVLLLRDLQQLSTEEVAEALGLSLPAAKSRLLRARLQLRDKLAPHLRRGWRLRLPRSGKGGRR
ncbi:MAG: sigma-70 family RNA polymerase sigma factor [Acidobacteria bacterium]|nr:sigma-70 family RNA polymerase sigma factor [Acidobacteriota bacterium]